MKQFKCHVLANDLIILVKLFPVDPTDYAPVRALKKSRFSFINNWRIRKTQQELLMYAIRNDCEKYLHEVSHD